jgi:uncharacterized protein
MRINLDLPWDRYAVIVEFAERLQKKGMNLGKTALQKHVYFLQTLFGIDCGYEFTLYTYGPFSSDLLSDLDVVDQMGGVDAEYDPSVSGYRIQPGQNAADIKKLAKPFIETASKAIDEVINNFGSFNARELELRATIVYAEKELEDSSRSVEEGDLVKAVRELKPYFSDVTVRNAIEKLSEKGFLALSA